MKNILIAFSILLVAGCVSKSVQTKQPVSRVINPLVDLNPCPTCPPSTNWPPPFYPPPIDTNQLWLSASQDDVNITILVNNSIPSHSYYLEATRALANPNWMLVTPFNGVSSYSLVMPKSYLATNAQSLYFRTQDVTQ